MIMDLQELCAETRDSIRSMGGRHILQRGLGFHFIMDGKWHSQNAGSGQYPEPVTNPNHVRRLNWRLVGKHAGRFGLVASAALAIFGATYVCIYGDDWNSTVLPNTNTTPMPTFTDTNLTGPGNLSGGVYSNGTGTVIVDPRNPQNQGRLR